MRNNVVIEGDSLAPKRKHKNTTKSKIKLKTKRIKAKLPVNVKIKKAQLKAGLKTKFNITATKKLKKESKRELLKAQELEKKENIDKAIKKIYAEKEKLEMQRLYSILSEPYARQLLIDLAGENALEIVRNFYGNLSDEDLAKKLKLKISDVRATLNKLHSEGLVNYIRDKDNETGWYSYSWALNRERIKNWVELKVKEKIDLVSGNLGEHYFCSSCGPSSIVKFEIATDTSFRCQKCNKNLDFLDEEKIVQLTDIRLRR